MDCVGGRYPSSISRLGYHPLSQIVLSTETLQYRALRVPPRTRPCEPRHPPPCSSSRSFPPSTRHMHTPGRGAQVVIDRACNLRAVNGRCLPLLSLTSPPCAPGSPRVAARCSTPAPTCLSPRSWLPVATGCTLVCASFPLVPSIHYAFSSWRCSCQLFLFLRSEGVPIWLSSEALGIFLLAEVLG
jgi:hypothetical protein